MSFIFLLHSLWRWVVLIVALAAIGKALVGWLGKQDWGALDNKLGLFYTIAFDIQLLLGLIVYGGAFMGVHQLNLYNWSIARVTGEHVVIMIIALVIAHVIRSRIKKETEALKKHRLAAIGFGISFILVLIAIPTWMTTATL